MTNIRYSSFRCRRPFGVELEIGNEIPIASIREIIKDYSFVPVKTGFYRASLNNSYWDIKHDGSCGKLVDKFGINEGGYEVCSYKAAHLNDLFHICNVAKSLKTRGCRVNRNCGLHIHIDVSDFSTQQMGVLISNWLKIEDTVLQLCHPSRRRNKYCNKFATSRVRMACDPAISEITGSDFWRHYRPRSTKLHDNFDRRLTLNLVNYFRYLTLKNYKRPTVEFRFPEGTLDAVVIKNWVRILVNFVNCMHVGKVNLNENYNLDLYKTLEVLGLHDENEFVILSPGLHESKKWVCKRVLKFADYLVRPLIVQQAEEILQRMGT